MSSVVSIQEDNSLTVKYRQVLNLFWSILNVDGETLGTKCLCGLDMPERLKQGSCGRCGLRKGTTIERKQEDWVWNKQVIFLVGNLIVFLSRFRKVTEVVEVYAAIARVYDVNKVLSGELNTFSDRIFWTGRLEVWFWIWDSLPIQGESPQTVPNWNINARKNCSTTRLDRNCGKCSWMLKGSSHTRQEETPIIGT